MRFDVLYNFMSPVTGRILCSPDYVLLGNNRGVATPSPILIDLRLDIIDIRKNFDKIKDISYILKTPTNLFPNAQALDNLANGFMINTGGVISTTANILPSNIRLNYNKLLIGDLTGKATETQTISFANLPDLTKDHGIKGDDNGRPIEFKFNFAPDDALFILKQPSDSLQNAQALNKLTGSLPRILKAALDGSIEVAIKDTDYATSEQLEQIKNETEQFKNQAQEASATASNAAEAASSAAAESSSAAATASSAATAAAGSAAAAALSAAGAFLSSIGAASSASSASSSADDAASSASSAQQAAGSAGNSATAAAGSATAALGALNTLLTTPIALQGDISGSGVLTAPITTKFIENPIFLGKEAMTLPIGSMSDRPIIPKLGMIRINTDL